MNCCYPSSAVSLILDPGCCLRISHQNGLAAWLGDCGDSLQCVVSVASDAVSGISGSPIWVRDRGDSAQCVLACISVDGARCVGSKLGLNGSCVRAAQWLGNNSTD